jgi:hypothetical protein
MHAGVVLFAVQLRCRLRAPAVHSDSGASIWGGAFARERIATDAVGEVAAAYVYLVMEWAKDVSACVCVASEECVALPR